MKKYIASVGASLLPAISFAQGNEVVVNDLNSLLQGIVQILNMIFPVLVAIAVFVIIIGIFKFVLNAGDEEARKTGRSFILWGIIGVFLMLSVWGLINIVFNSFQLDNTVENVTLNILGDPSSYVQ